MTSPHEPGDDRPDFRKLFESLLGGGAADPQMADALKSMGLDKIDPQMMAMLAGQLSAMFSGPAEPGINLSLCSDVARKTISTQGDTSVSEAQTRSVTESGHVAGLWLDAVTSFSASGPVRAWSRAEWVEATMPTWGALVAPVADGVTRAITSAMRSQLDQLGEGGLSNLPGLPEGMALPPGMDLSSMLGQVEPMLARMSGSMFGAQIGQAVGTLAGHVLSGTEVGLPLVAEESVVLLPANVAEFAKGLEVDDRQVEMFLAVRETARVRLFADVPWLGPQLVAAVQAYARDISIDTAAIESKLSSIDPTDAQAMQEALTGSLFSPEPSEAQRAALVRLETLLALVEGWVDVVADRATAGHLPQAAALGEAVRRRRATEGPAEQLFSQLVGLELRPRRLRDAANLFAALEDAGGASARDAAWAHPDVAPTAADLDDPLGYVEGRSSSDGTQDDVDAALAAIFAESDAAARRGDLGPESGPSDAGPWPHLREGGPGTARPDDDEETGSGPTTAR